MQTMKHGFLIASCAVLGTAFSCASSGGKPADVETLGLPQIDTKRNFPASSRFEPVGLRPGQFATYLITQPNGAVMKYTQKVTSKGNVPYSFWIEEEVVTKSGTKTHRSLILMDDARLAVANQKGEEFVPVISDYAKVSQVLVKDDEEFKAGKVSSSDELPGLKIRLSLLGGLKTSKGKKTESKAGVFEKCFDATANFYGPAKDGQWAGCVATVVPFNGIVVATDPEQRKWEVVDFGVESSAK